MNESLQRLDALTQLTVASAATSAQPGAPADGQLHILPPGKTGDAWGAMADFALAYYRDGAWEEIAPRAGWRAYVKDADALLVYTGAAWALLAPGQLTALSASDKIVGRVSSGAGPAEEIAFTDQAQALCDDASFRAMCATLGAWHVLAASAVALAHTGSTSETALATVQIPAHAMGPNGVLRITSLWSATPNANVKTARIRFGGASMWAGSLSTNTSMQHQFTIANANAANAQKAFSGGGAFSGSANAPSTASNDTTANQDLTLRATLANAGDTLTLESYVVELAHGA